MDILIFDTETTGLIDSELIELSSLYIHSDGTKDHKTFRMKPESPVLPSSTIVHGITQDEANTYESSEIVVPKIYDYFKTLTSPLAFVGHNVLFDISVVNDSFSKYVNSPFQPKIFIDTLKLSKKMIRSSDIGGYKLDAVFYYLFPDKLDWLLANRNTHDAATDCDITYQILVELKRQYENSIGRETSWKDIVEYAAAPIDLSEETWAFGKYKGIKFKDTPLGYIRWCLTSDFKLDLKNSDIVYTLKKVLAKIGKDFCR